MAGPGRHTPFVGRQKELATLTARLIAAARGQGGVVLVAGEPGIGKTRLLAELSDRAAASSWLTLVGRALDGEGTPSYLPFVEALRGYVRTSSTEVLRALVAAGAADVALLVPELRDRLPDLPARRPGPAEHERYRLFERVTDFVLAIAEASERGLLLLLDDLHWADTSTVLLLLHLARRCTQARLLVVAAYRTTDIALQHPLSEVLADLHRERLADRVALGALPPDETATLIADLATVAPAPELVMAVHRETGGNAFFVEEVVQQLLSDGRDLAAPGRAVVDWNLPEGVRQVVGRRLSRLSQAANRLLQCAAVLGEGATLPVLAAATGLAWAALTEALEESTRAGMLRETLGAYGFRHALIQQTVLEELSLPRRQHLHLEIAAAIERVYAGNPASRMVELATHYRQAGALADPDKALAYLHWAAEAASSVFAWEEAAGFLQAVLDLLGTQGPEAARQVCETLLVLGEVQRRAGEYQQALDSFQQAVASARQLGAAELFARAALRFFGKQSDPTYLAVLEEAAQMLAADDSSLRASVLARLAVVVNTMPGISDWRERSSSIGEQAVTMARRLTDGKTLLYVLRNWIQLLRFPKDLDQRRIAAFELIRLGQEHHDLDAELHGHEWQATAAVEVGDRFAFDAEYAICHRLANETRQPFDQWRILQPRVMRAVLDGQFEESERLAADALRIGRTAPPGEKAAIATYSYQLYALRLEQGRLRELEVACRTAGEQRLLYGKALLALLYSELEQPEEARNAFEQLAAHEFVRQPGDLDIHPWIFLPLAAQACAYLGDGRRAWRLYSLLTPFASRVIAATFLAVCMGPADYYLGLLATTLRHWDAADRHFATALTLAQGLRDRPHQAHILHAHGAMLLARRRPGDRSRAQPLFMEAIALYDQMGMLHFAARTRALLREAGRTLPPRRASLPAGLSPREAEVLRLVAAGKTNREIAALLVVSPRTVTFHLSGIFNKTGTTNRTEAAAYAYQQRLLDPEP